MGHVGHVMGDCVGSIFGFQSECWSETRVVLRHCVLEHVVGKLWRHGGHHLLHLDTFRISESRGVDHVQLCSEVSRLRNLPTLGGLNMLSVEISRKSISLMLQHKKFQLK